MIEQNERRKSKKTIPGFMLVLLLVLFLLAVLIWGYNLTRLKTVEYEGLTRYSEEEFTRRLSSSPVTKNTFGFLAKHALLPEKEIPFVEGYDTEYTDRNTVKVRVYEKLVTGCVEIMGKYMYFDKDGIVVESASERLDGVPLILGLEFNEIVLYEKLKVQKQSLFTTILNLTKLLLEYEIEAGQITIDSNYEVVLNLGELKVLLGKRDVYDEQISALHGILKAAGGRAGTLDMRNYSKENQDVILK